MSGDFLSTDAFPDEQLMASGEDFTLLLTHQNCIGRVPYLRRCPWRHAACVGNICLRKLMLSNFRQSVPDAACKRRDNLLFPMFSLTSISWRRKRVAHSTRISVRRDILSFPTKCLLTPLSASAEPRILVVLYMIRL